MHLVQVSGEILNSTLINNPDIDWVPQQWEESVNSMLDNAYLYGRTAISDGVRALFYQLTNSMNYEENNAYLIRVFLHQLFIMN